MTRTPAQRRKKKNPWDRAIQAPRIDFEKNAEKPACSCGHRIELHEGFHIGKPKKCCYFDVGGRNKCQCKKYVKAA